MNKKDKIEILLEDERNRRKERDAAIENVLNGPILGETRVDHPFQYDTVKAGESQKLVFNIDVPGDKALLVKQIANEWYPDTTFELNIDGKRNEHRRRLSDPEDPLETAILVRKTIEWRVTNNSNEDRTIGILSDGFYIPKNIYQSIRDNYEKLGGNLNNLSAEGLSSLQ